MQAVIQDGRFEQMGRRVHTPLVPIWEDNQKTPGKQNLWHKQIYHVNSITDFTVAKLKKAATLADNDPLKTILQSVSTEEWEMQCDPVQKIEQHLDLIEQHVDRRIQLFFMQLICCYRTPYHFEWIKANDEYGKGGKIRMKNPDGDETQLVQTEAAHSGTFPCLKAYSRAKWDRGDHSGGFIYLKYGRTYLNNNSTIEFDRYLNRADCLIDGTSTNRQLREKAIKIINAVAKGRYDVKRGMKNFTRLLEQFCITQRDRLPNSDSRHLILDRYAIRVREVKAVMDQDEGYFDQILGVKVDEHPKEAILRDLVYRKRFKLIQNCEAIESQIARAILNSQNAMLRKRGKHLNSLDYRLRYILLEEQDPYFKRILERLFCTSLEQLQADIEKNEARLKAFERKNRIASFRVKHRDAISILKRDLRALFRSLDNLELNFRSELFKDLRVGLNNWRQKDFAAEFKRKYPNDPMSNSAVSRLEQRSRTILPRVYKTPLSQRRKDIPELFARKIADTFGIDPGLFLPSLFTSMS